MNKIICSIIMFFITSQIVYAENVTQEELLARFKTHRSAIYQKLDLTQEQTESIKKIDEKIYVKLESELNQLAQYINKIDEIANSDNCTIGRINQVKDEFKTTEKRIESIKSKHEKAINQILTEDQKVAYEAAKEAQRKEIQKEIEGVNKRGK